MTDQMFTTRDLPWMKLGAVLPEGQATTAQEAAELGGLNFEVELVDAGFRTASGNWQHVESRRAVVRQDTGKWLSYASNDYKPVQYGEAFTFMDQVNPSYVAAGTMNDGRQGFMVVQLPEHAHLELNLRGHDDPHDLYVVLRTSHDLSKAIEVAVMALRGKCMNQLTLPSLTRSAVQRWSIRHVGDPKLKLEQALSTLHQVDAYTREFEAMATRLAELDVQVSEAEETIRAILPDRPRRDEQVESIISRFQNSPFVGEEYWGTGWGLVNAVSDYFEHGRESKVRTAASRFTGGLNGDTHKYTGRTAQLLLRRG